MSVEIRHNSYPIAVENGTVLRIATIIFLAFVFFFVQYTPAMIRFEDKPLDYYALDLDMAVKDYQKGSLFRQVSLLSLGFLGLFIMFGKNRTPAMINGFLGWLVIFYLIWSTLSLTWADDISITTKRLIAFSMLCIGAFALIRRFQFEEIIWFIFVIAVFYLVAGVLLEIAQNTFDPVSERYRFGGFFHPNAMGANCALLVLVSLYLGEKNRRRHHFFLAVSILALVFLLFTRSRTMFAGIVLTLVFRYTLLLPKKRILIYLLSVIWVVCLIELFSGGAFLSTVRKGLLLGRTESDLLTLTGRIPLWDELLRQSNQRKVLGYGFGGFWNASRVSKLSGLQGWTIGIGHSNYIDQLLELGIVGFASYITIIVLGIKRSWTYFRITTNGNYLFISSLLVFISLISFMETVIPYPSLITFIMVFSLASLAFQAPLWEDHI